jgi:trk system potassium uptake protein TrkA
MKSVIVGGGKIGYNLLKTLKERGHHVTLVERDKNTCLKISEDIDTDVIWGDGTNPEILKDAGIEEADIIAAVTGTDEENLVICKIAKMNFNTKRTIARVNNPKNTKVFKTLGIDNTVCSTAVIANLIEYELDNENYRIVNTFERGAMILVELLINDGSIWCGKSIKDLALPVECIFISVLRGEGVIYPKGDTRLLGGDKVLAVTNNSVLPVLVKGLYGGGSGN